MCQKYFALDPYVIIAGFNSMWVITMAQATFIQDTIKQQGSISFYEFMHLALYHPQYGYYSRGENQIGRQGDFITAPELTPLFGYTLANQLASIFASMSQPSLLEFGAGNGSLMVSILTQLEKLNALPENYYILDVSGSLKDKQQQLLDATLPHLKERVIFLDSLPDKPFDGVIIANEVLDAMPVHRFKIANGQVLEVWLETAENGQFKEVTQLARNSLRHQVDKQLPLAEGYCSEVNLNIKPWLKSIDDFLSKGVMLLIDYGFSGKEYYHPDRVMGTLMCHYKQQSHVDPYKNIGFQDITAHVDFTEVAESALSVGLDVVGFTNQAAFLLSLGLTDFLNDPQLDEKQRFKFNQAVKMLTLPSEMGELFKVMALTKEYDEPLQGFNLLDLRRTL